MNRANKTGALKKAHGEEACGACQQARPASVMKHGGKRRSAWVGDGGMVDADADDVVDASRQ